MEDCDECVLVSIAMQASVLDTPTAIHAWLTHQDEAAARWLFDTYRPCVRRVIYRWLPYEQMIDDVIQETFIKSFKALHRFVPQGNFEAWLCTIARHCCSNHLRTLERTLVRSATDCGINDFTNMLVSRDKAMNEDQESEQVVNRLLSHLRQQDRNLVNLYHYEGLSTREVGGRLGITEGNVRIRLMRSHRTLRGHAQSMRAAGLL